MTLQNCQTHLKRYGDHWNDHMKAKMVQVQILTATWPVMPKYERIYLFEHKSSVTEAVPDESLSSLIRCSILLSSRGSRTDPKRTRVGIKYCDEVWSIKILNSPQLTNEIGRLLPATKCTNRLSPLTWWGWSMSHFSCDFFAMQIQRWVKSLRNYIYI